MHLLPAADICYTATMLLAASQLQLCSITTNITITKYTHTHTHTSKHTKSLQSAVIVFFNCQKTQIITKLTVNFQHSCHWQTEADTTEQEHLELIKKKQKQENIQTTENKQIDRRV